MRKPFIVAFVAALTSSSVHAQQTLLSENFDSGLVPPLNWVEQNNGASVGWEADLTGSEAEHDDFLLGQLNENRLLTPSLDATALSALYLHATQDQQFPEFRVRNAVEVSLDGGMTFVEVWQETSSLPFTDGSLEVDLSAYAGLGDVTISFAYEGEYANIWRIDDVVIDDQPPTAVPLWPNLPSAFVAASGYRQDFEALAGVVPDHMSLNELDSSTRTSDPLAWCNIGNRAAPIDAYNGQFCLEMGLQPGATDFHFVSNSMVLGLTGSMGADLTLSFQATSYGDEAHADDGVFVSLDGQDWVALTTDWTQLVGIDQGDQALVVVDLRSSGLDLDGNFYLAIAQQDDFPFADLDGVMVDEITVGMPVLDFGPISAGLSTAMTVTGARVGADIILGYSRLPGPQLTPYGVAGIGSPFVELGRYIADAAGEAADTLFVPPRAAGLTVWIQTVDVIGVDGRFSNVWRLEL